MHILFVCTGNICRSPAAENIFREHARRAGILPELEIDSAGTGDWHEGEDPDHRSADALCEAGYAADGRALRRRVVHAHRHTDALAGRRHDERERQRVAHTNANGHRYRDTHGERHEHAGAHTLFHCQRQHHRQCEPHRLAARGRERL
jgi:protein-tyrosine-phosphatase